MRTAGLYIAALCTGSVAVRAYHLVVELTFGTLTGPAAILYVLGSIGVLVLVTAWVFSVLAVPKPRRSRVAK